MVSLQLDDLDVQPMTMRVRNQLLMELLTVFLQVIQQRTCMEYD
jgi:hypothetical protein